MGIESPFVRDFDLLVNRGLVTGHSFVHKFGESHTVGNTQVDIWHGSGNLVWPQAATKLDIVSDDDDDDVTDDGARVIHIVGLDGNFVEQEEDVDLDGTDTVTTDGTYIRLIRAFITSAGVYTGTNEGDITIRVTGGGDIQAVMEGGDGQTHRTHFTTSATQTGYIRDIEITVDSNKTSSIFLFKRENANDVTGPAYTAKRTMHTWQGVVVPLSIPIIANHKLPPMTDVWFEGSASGANSTISVDYALHLIESD